MSENNKTDQDAIQRHIDETRRQYAPEVGSFKPSVPKADVENMHAPQQVQPDFSEAQHVGPSSSPSGKQGPEPQKASKPEKKKSD